MRPGVQDTPMLPDDHQMLFYRKTTSKGWTFWHGTTILYQALFLGLEKIEDRVLYDVSIRTQEDGSVFWCRVMLLMKLIDEMFSCISRHCFLLLKIRIARPGFYAVVVGGGAMEWRNKTFWKISANTKTNNNKKKCK